MTKTYSHTFDTPLFKGTVEIPTDLYIGGRFVGGVEGKTIEYVAFACFP
jgi:aldehyde dehydrogenase (NAD+)